MTAKDLQIRWKYIELCKYRSQENKSQNTLSTAVSTATIKLDQDVAHIEDTAYGALENEHFKLDYLNNDKLFAKKAPNLFMETDLTNGLVELD